MAAILVDDNFKCILLNENDKIPIEISFKFVPRSPIDDKAALVQVMAWRQTGDKPFPEPMLTQFTDAYIQQWGRWVDDIPFTSIWKTEPTSMFITFEL